MHRSSLPIYIPFDPFDVVLQTVYAQAFEIHRLRQAAWLVGDASCAVVNYKMRGRVTIPLLGTWKRHQHPLSPLALIQQKAQKLTMCAEKKTEVDGYLRHRFTSCRSVCRSAIHQSLQP